jgi:hypothetical protein
MDINPDTIPRELRDRAQWVCWRLTERNGRKTKVPIDPATGRNAAADNPATWGTFDAALSRCRGDSGLAGVGFMFSEDDPYCGIDLDHVHDPATGETNTEAAAIIADLATYTEQSQSRRGYHLICRAALPGHRGRRKEPVELYDSRRFFVMTGRHKPETPATIEDRQPQVDALFNRLFPPTASTPPATARPAADLADADLIEKARAAKNGAAFSALYDAGDWKTGGYPSQSEADAALCSMLAFWTAHNPEQIDRLFRGSALMRDKWNRRDYRDATIQKAMQGRECYTPRTVYPTAGQRNTATRSDRLAALRSGHTGPLVEFLTPSQFRALSVPERFNLVGDYHIQRGAPFVIAGASGVGKSRAATALAVAGATRADWFGLPVHHQFKTMILQAENGPVRLRNEYHEITAAGLDDFIRICPPPPFGFAFDMPAFADQLAEAVDDFRPDVFLVDPWNRLAVDDKGKDYREAYERLMSVLPTGDALPALGIVAHTRKPRTDERANGRALMNLIAGSYMLASIPRAIFMMQAASDDSTDFRVVWTCCKNNDGELGERTAWERRNGLFDPVPGFDWQAFDGRGDPRRTITEEDLETLFHGGKRTMPRKEAAKELQDLTGLKNAACYNALKTEDGRFSHRITETEEGELAWT